MRVYGRGRWREAGSFLPRPINFSSRGGEKRGLKVMFRATVSAAGLWGRPLAKRSILSASPWPGCVFPEKKRKFFPCPSPTASEMAAGKGRDNVYWESVDAISFACLAIPLNSSSILRKIGEAIGRHSPSIIRSSCWVAYSMAIFTTMLSDSST